MIGLITYAALAFNVVFAVLSYRNWRLSKKHHAFWKDRKVRAEEHLRTLVRSGEFAYWHSDKEMPWAAAREVEHAQVYLEIEDYVERGRTPSWLKEGAN